MRLLFSVFALILSGFVHATPLDKIVVFGDSLSDNGNLYQLTEHFVPNSPPYYEGRFTNGPVWVEALAESYYHENSSAYLRDYAFGGASISDDPRLPTLKNQIALYLNAHQGKADENNLYIIWIGANNYVAMPNEDVDQTVAKVTMGIRAGVESLIKGGAKHFMLVNLPDLGITPMPKELFDDPDNPDKVDQVRELLSRYSNKHNDLLPQTVSDLKDANQGVDVLLFDANSEISHISAEGKFNNITQSCYATRIDKPTANVSLQIAAKVKLPPTPNENLCKEFLFFDALHPTVKVHRLFAAKVKEFLTTNGIEFSSTTAG
ncbi:Phosphatidylcholine-sterol acyltransferase precursor [Legionella massiliensis]|uniref:Phosphatidylcholine-sterol acyltransferase n=1 Tax=Legionella massiliensis TaxID=1034943 RepID=A0A078KVE3_9GAMM|nr:SGNH/GDSL hydrolase family protein [Legionella massiliensis]CDZ76942.1 Phosphatidylcholine-sterol acyltransferase precursor [Legionella massiliensis]CEE12680.1 Phosphatidylcholine-sterol acyltransferase precursor [Legionella massiliensis]